MNVDFGKDTVSLPPIVLKFLLTILNWKYVYTYSAIQLNGPNDPEWTKSFLGKKINKNGFQETANVSKSLAHLIVIFTSVST